ncbi:hypothetical protein DENSPDRAFT_833419 [Dentipellis sp. KUC8613]|nr:hypothetical protein DENSPDRAFT_833419 [Dentipellis sp. KUC8613]
MKPRNYCCCAIPVVNAGVYATLTEQLVLGILVGTLSVATTHIVGAATPSFAKWIMAVICYVGAAIQILGFVGVAQERSILFRRYLTLHIMVTLAAFSVAAVWIGLSAGRHNTAQSNCERDFFTASQDGIGSASVLASEGNTMCNIFPWVDIGLMGALWVLLAISQFYFYYVLSGYGTGQRIDHEKYDSVYSTSNMLNDDIPMTRTDPWKKEPSSDSLGGRPGYGHNRTESTTSDVAMLQDPNKPSFGGPLSYPVGAHTQDPAPTPQYNAQQDPYYSNTSWPGHPEATQAHPGQS